MHTHMTDNITSSANAGGKSPGAGVQFSEDKQEKIAYIVACQAHPALVKIGPALVPLFIFDSPPVYGLKG